MDVDSLALLGSTGLLGALAGVLGAAAYFLRKKADAVPDQTKAEVKRADTENTEVRNTKAMLEAAMQAAQWAREDLLKAQAELTKERDNMRSILARLDECEHKHAECERKTQELELKLDFKIRTAVDSRFRSTTPGPMPAIQGGKDEE